MELKGKLGQLKLRQSAQRKYIHSPSHQLADELSKMFADPGHFGAYLKLALSYNHEQLRKLAAEVKEQQNVQSPAKLFMFLVKKNLGHKKM